MGKDIKKKKESQLEVEGLRFRLEEAEETLRAIRRGEVDGLIVSGPEGDRVFSLRGAERSYRFFVEAMNEGAVTLAFDGTILYCNDRFAEMLGTPYQKLIGDSIYRFISSPEAFDPAFQRGKGGRSKTETFLKREDHERVPVSLSFNPTAEDEASGVCMVVMDLTEHMRAEERVKESERHLRHLSSQLLVAQENERKRIAGEIHDGLGQMLSSAKFKLDDAVRRIKGEAGKGALESLEAVDSMLQEATEEARRVQLDLRPSILDDLGILPALSWFSRRFQTTYPAIRVEQETALREEEVPESLKTVIYRILQEAFNNIGKHGGADCIKICLRKTDRIELLIQDNGRGFDLKEKLSLDGSKRGLGLSSMRERAELSGGSFDIESSVGKGTIVRASWPLR